jgi:hypothetical protein
VSGGRAWIPTLDALIESLFVSLATQCKTCQVSSLDINRLPRIVGPFTMNIGSSTEHEIFRLILGQQQQPLSELKSV